LVSPETRVEAEDEKATTLPLALMALGDWEKVKLFACVPLEETFTRIVVAAFLAIAGEAMTSSNAKTARPTRSVRRRETPIFILRPLSNERIYRLEHESARRLCGHQAQVTGIVGGERPPRSPPNLRPPKRGR
jgi:hypothetical protein